MPVMRKSEKNSPSSSFFLALSTAFLLFQLTEAIRFHMFACKCLPLNKEREKGWEEKKNYEIKEGTFVWWHFVGVANDVDVSEKWLVEKNKDQVNN